MMIGMQGGPCGLSGQRVTVCLGSSRSSAAQCRPGSTVRLDGEELLFKSHISYFPFILYAVNVCGVPGATDRAPAHVRSIHLSLLEKL